MRVRTVIAVVAVTALGATAVYAHEGIKDADRNGDGMVSLEEVKAAQNAGIEEHFARVDANADGLLSADEMAAAKKARRGIHDKRHDGRRHGKGNPEQMLKGLDTDGNGSLSMAELDGKRFSPDAAAFQAADADGSGELNATEVQAMLKARRAERRGPDRDKEG